MKILVVVPYFTSLFKQNEYGLCTNLADLGHEVLLLASNRKMKKFYFDVSEKGIGERIEQELDGFKVLYLPTLFDFLEQPFIPSIGQEIEFLNPDVVHVHEDFQNCSFLALLAAEKKSIPLVLSEERYYFPKGFFRLLYSLYSSTIARRVRDEAIAITAHTNTAKEFLVSLGTKSNRIEVVPVGIDPEEFKPIKQEKFFEKFGVAGAKTILTVARLHPNKGLIYLLQAMTQIIEDHPCLRLVIIGRGSLEKQIRELIHQLKLEKHVVLLTDPIPNEEMSKIYPGCDIFVLPSIKEPFGRVLLEAMACGKPVVATKVGGPLDIVEDGRTGYLVDKANPNQLAARISEFLQDRNKIRSFGRAGRERVVKRFDWKKIAKRYVKIYESVQDGTGRLVGT